jgi:rod shape-determining protein MreC
MVFNSKDSLVRPDRPPEREAPEKVQLFVVRRSAFFILMGVLIAQLLLLSAQITRNQKVRLIQVWAVAALEPFERAIHSVTGTAQGTWQSYRGLFTAQEENHELHIQLTNARAQIQQLSEQAAETRRLRELLEFKSHLPFQTVAAEIIATSPGDASHAIFIDKGEINGVAADAAVITPLGVVGKVISVFPRTAQVLLITDASSGVAAALSQSRVQGIVKGSGQNSSELQYIMKDIPVAAGETVLTSGLDQVYPKGLVIGTIVQVSDGNIYRIIKIKPAAELDRLEDVLVVVKPRSIELQALTGPSRAQ